MTSTVGDDEGTLKWTPFLPGLVILLVGSHTGLIAGVAWRPPLSARLLAATCVWAALVLPASMLLEVVRRVRRRRATIEPSHAVAAGALAIVAMMLPGAPLIAFNLLCYGMLTAEDFGTPPDGGFDVEMPEFFALCWAMLSLSWLLVALLRIWRRDWPSVAVAATALLCSGVACALNAAWMERCLQAVW